MVNINSISDSDIDVLLEQAKEKVTNSSKYAKTIVISTSKTLVVTSKNCLTNLWNNLPWAKLAETKKSLQFTISKIPPCLQEVKQGVVTGKYFERETIEYCGKQSYRRASFYARAVHQKARELGPVLIVFSLLILGAAYNTFSALGAFEKNVYYYNVQVAELMTLPYDPAADARAARELPRAALPRAEPLTAPKPFKRGGIIYFIHIPQTKGHVIRDFLEKRGEHQIARRKGQWKTMTDEIEALLVKGPGGLKGKIHSYESHGHGMPPYTQISPMVKKWREIAAKKKVPLFIFSVLQEPTVLQFQSFNFYYLGNKEVLAKNTPKEFLATLMHNPQCEFLTRGGGIFSMLDGHQRNDAAIKKINDGLSDQECDEAYTAIFEDVDWLGRTDMIWNETLPLLYHVTGSGDWPKDVGDRIPDAPAKMTSKRLDASQKGIVKESVRMDRKYYRAALERFRYKDFGAAIEVKK